MLKNMTPEPMCAVYLVAGDVSLPQYWHARKEGYAWRGRWRRRRWRRGGGEVEVVVEQEVVMVEEVVVEEVVVMMVERDVE